MELVLSAFDHSCSGFFLFPRSMLHLGSLTSVLGKCHLDPSSLLLDMVTFGSPLSLHNAICLESFSPVSELVTFDPSLFSRSVAHLDLSMFPLGSVWIGLPPPPSVLPIWICWFRCGDSHVLPRASACCPSATVICRCFHKTWRARISCWQCWVVCA